MADDRVPRKTYSKRPQTEKLFRRTPWALRNSGKYSNIPAEGREGGGEGGGNSPSDGFNQANSLHSNQVVNSTSWCLEHCFLFWRHSFIIEVEKKKNLNWLPWRPIEMLNKAGRVMLLTDTFFVKIFDFVIREQFLTSNFDVECGPSFPQQSSKNGL